MLKNPYFYTHVVLSVLLISSFIAIFFFTYASRVERAIVIRQTEQLVDSLVGGSSALFPDQSYIRDAVQNLSVGDMTRDDERIRVKNQQLFKKAALFIGIFAGCLFVVAVVLIYVSKLDWKRLLATNLVILFVVALVEFLFLTFVAQNYISFDPNYVKYIVLDNLQKFKKK